jgi:hypothetical protein
MDFSQAARPYVYRLKIPLSGELIQSDRFFDLRYSVGTKVLCHLQKHFRLVQITQYGDSVCSVFTAFFSLKYKGESSVARLSKDS